MKNGDLETHANKAETMPCHLDQGATPYCKSQFDPPRESSKSAFLERSRLYLGGGL